jgi:hypothetical protein
VTRTHIPDDDLEFANLAEPPQDSLSLRIYTPELEALDLAKDAGRQQDTDEFVVLLAPEADLPGMIHMRTFAASRAAEAPNMRDALMEIVDRLRAGALEAATVDTKGETRRVERSRWRARDAAEIVRTGRMGDADVYLITDVVAAQLDQPISTSAEPDRPGWWPGELESLKAWCTRDDVETAAKDLLAQRGAKNPSENQVCKTLSEMWIAAGKKGGVPKTIAATRSQAKSRR